MLDIRSFRRCCTTLFILLLSFFHGTAANYLCLSVKDGWPEIRCENAASLNIQYSLDDGQTWEVMTDETTITLDQEEGLEKALFKGQYDESRPYSKSNAPHFLINGYVNASGSVMSLVDGEGTSTVIPVDYCFYGLFKDCEELQQAPELPATTLTNYCYASMFEGCVYMEKAAELPATTLKRGCYQDMFRSTGITQAPELPATELAEYCYSGMFRTCLFLTEAPVLPATRLAIGCYSDMFNACMGLKKAPELPAPILSPHCYSGMFTMCMISEAPALPATQLAENCYENMFESCSKLTEAPALPATQLARYCYTGMFKNCTALLSAPELPATQMEDFCYSRMFEECTGLAIASKLPATALKKSCYQWMYKKCTSLERAPLLPAATLVTDCYKGMFQGCTSLNYIEVGTKDLEADAEATTEWVDNVENDGVFVFPCGSTYNKHGISAVPDNFVIRTPQFIVIFQNPDKTVLEKDTVECGGTPAYHGAGDPTYGENRKFIGWDIDPSSIQYDGAPAYYVTAEYERTYDPNTVDYLCFTAEEAGAQIQYINKNGNNPNVEFSRNPDNGWTQLNEGVSITLENVGDRVYFRGNNPDGFSQTILQRTQFAVKNKIAASGSVMSLIDGKGASLEIPNRDCFCHLFEACKTLTTAPELPATTLKSNCYAYMFDSCYSLTKMPELPARTLADSCYRDMFSHCTSLSEIQRLPVTTLTNGCYMGMFSYCTSLTHAPELPAKELTPYCYMSMFSNCTSLVQTPQLPATKLAEVCYSNMFTACESLTEAPELPALKLERECYSNMFERCFSLETVPYIAATSLGSMSCFMMFYSCNKLNYIRVGVMTLDGTDAFAGWMAMVDGPGKFIFPCGSTYDKHGASEVPTNFDIVSSPIIVYMNPDGSVLRRDTIDCGETPDYGPEAPFLDDGHVFVRWDKEMTRLDDPDIYYYVAEYEKAIPPTPGNWLCFTAQEANSTISCVNVGGNTPDIQYSIDEGKTWNVLSENGSVELEAEGDRVFFKGINPEGFSSSEQKYSQFMMSGKIEASGSVMSLIDGEGTSTVIPNDYCFCNLFARCSALLTPPELPATELKDWCYSGMFGNCANLSYAPELPATEMQRGCYYSMFTMCTSLTTTPDLISTSLANRCYCNMFGGCSALTQIIGLPATKMEVSCYESMFAGCSSLKEAPNLPATELADSCYTRMFTACTGLKKAAELPATKLSHHCYAYMYVACSNLTDVPDFPEFVPATECCYLMFTSCTSLVDAPAIPAKQTSPWCYLNMFSNCTSLTKAPELHATEMAPYCYAGMFDNCTSLTEATELPAMKLDTACYSSMFSGCAITEAPELPASDLALACYSGMFSNCANLGKAPELPATTLAEECYSGMFKGCTSLVEAPELPAEELIEDCYKEMFKGCSKLNYIKVGVMSLDYQAATFDLNLTDPLAGATNKWVEGVNGEGLFIFPCGSTYDKHGISQVPSNFTIKASPIIIFQNEDSTVLWSDTINCNEMPVYGGEPLPSNFIGWEPELTVAEEADVYYYTAQYEGEDPAPGKWLCFTAEMDSSKVWFRNTNNQPDIQYSLDNGETWETWGNQVPIVLKKTGDKVYVRGVNPDGFSHTIGYTILASQNPEVAANTHNTAFGMSGRIAASGSVMSLIDGVGEADTIPCKYCFSYLFAGCSALTKAPELTATTLADYCYSRMFGECTSLSQTPEFPATQLADTCYSAMFINCSDLTDVAELNATDLAPSCYRNMFYGCTKLTKAPKLSATQLVDNCYGGMFANCTSLTEAPELPATELANACYSDMFKGCTELEKAPDLMATSLVRNCYANMFNGCTSLNYIKVGVMTLDNDSSATENWVEGIDGEGVFIFPCGSTYDKHGISEVPDNFTIISSPIVIFQNPDSTELWRDTIDCNVKAEYKGETPFYKEGLLFSGWEPELTSYKEAGVYYYTAQYEDPSANNWLCFTAESDNASFFYMSRGQYDPDVQYSTDGGATWNSLAYGDTVWMGGTGNKVYLRGNNPNGFSMDPNEYSYFVMNTGDIAASGSVMSLVDGKGLSTTIPNDYCFAYLFEWSESLTKAPELPATNLKNNCYEGMFWRCSRLKQAPELPATTLASRCYLSMFAECSSLEKAPELPATELAPYCYSYMFDNCYQMTEAPELPAEIMKDGCYKGMFQMCSALTDLPELKSTNLAKECYLAMFAKCLFVEKAPELPATELAESCYALMFQGCMNLTSAPELPAENLAEDCYYSMFVDCSSLETAPILPATQLVPACYNSMFQGCSSLNYIEVGVMTLDNDFMATSNWVNGVNEEGLFVFPCGSKYNKHGIHEVPDNFTIKASPIVIFQDWDSTELQRDTIDCKTLPEYRGEEPVREGYTFMGWDPELSVHPDPDVYYYTAQYKEEGDITPGNWLCFTAEEAGSTVWYENRNGNYSEVQCSIDGGETWHSLDARETVRLENVGDKVYFKGNNPEGFSHGSETEGEESPYTMFGMTGYIAASGSVMSLIDGEGTSTEIPNDYCFFRLFYNCTSLTQAPELPATKLTVGCYEDMFYQCASLEKAPELPATQLEEGCYSRMFMYCESLTQAPVLSALEMKEHCYSNMFFACRKLEKAPELPATTLATGCYAGMFSDCQKLVVAPELPATTLAGGCYTTMFYKCYALTQAPQLPATKMVSNCYAFMFSLCESLVTPPDLPADILAEGCYQEMFSNCVSLSTAPELPASTLATNCYFKMFGNCSSLTRAPELPATQLAELSYANMFNGCTSLNYIKVGVMSLDNDESATYNWVSGVDGPGTFIFPCGSKYDKHGDSEVPTNFTIVASPIVVFQNPGGLELWRDTVDCKTVPEYGGEEPFIGDGYTFVGWDNELTVLPIPDTYYFTAVYEEVGAPESGNWLCFTAEEAGSAVWYTNVNGNSPDLQYSIDGGRTWQPLEDGEKVTLGNVGDKVYLKGDNPSGFSTSGPEKYTHFGMSGKVAGGGSVMSLIDGAGETTAMPCDYCFYSLFEDCAALTKAPELPATTLTKGCYSGMFSGCESLTQAPVLPATTLTESCYQSMFAGCTSLVTPPDLPAATMSAHCYEDMFKGCSQLEEAPELPATALVEGCYKGMFEECSSLNYVKVGVMSLDNDFGATENWVSGVDGPGTFIFPCGSKYDKHGVSEVPEDFIIIASPIVVFQNPDNTELWRDTTDCETVPEYKGATPTYGEGSVFKGWDEEPAAHPEPGTYYYTAVYEEVDPTQGDWLCFTAEKEGSEIWVGVVDEDGDEVEDKYPDLQYSIDEGKTWTPLAPKEIVTLKNVGDKVYFKGNNPDGFSQSGRRTSFHMSGLIAASGNVMSLIDGVGETTVIPNNECFTSLFKGCAALTKAPELPATKLTNGCYFGMFWGCENLLEAPELPAMELTESCYLEMFEFCNSLTKAPTLPATKLTYLCYGGMFRGCGRLTQVPDLPATELAVWCYSNMFESCRNLVTPPEMPATKLANMCYDQMFLNCTSLKKTPKLPATELATDCYRDMFVDCTSLTEVSELPATELAFGCYWRMFMGCTSLKDAPALPATELKEHCYQQMFSGCSSLVKAPELPAEELAEECYASMFLGCSSLNYIKVGVMTLDNDFDATAEWVAGVDGPGVFIFPCGSTYDKHGESEVPPLFEIVRDMPIIVFMNPDSTVLWRDSINCGETPEYGGETPTMGEGYTFKGWDKDLSVVESSGTYYFTALYDYEDPELTKKLQLTVEDELYLVLPGGSETIFYELTGGEGSKYEVRYNNQTICSGDVANDSTVSLTCPKDLEPGAYEATMVMYDEEGYFSKRDFTFNVMLPDNKQKSNYVKVWNDVVICRNGEGQFLTYQWYKGRKKCENAALQYFNDVTLLDGEYMVYVSDKDGRSYFIEPVTYAPVEAAYAITAEPNVVAKGTEFTLKVSGVAEEDLKDARIVVYRANGVVEKLFDEVELEKVMRLKSGEYVIVLTVKDGKNANCKVLVK
ncbi:MAG: leucine-rich repeat protein [Paludibacteraceae bacterium]|nr:leucine-rich repeat protein [Paludibacteraceae bacterium]